MLDEVAKCSLLDLVFGGERLEVGKGASDILVPLVHRSRVRLLLELAGKLKPLVLEGISGSQTNVLFAKHVKDEVLGLRRNLIPHVSLELELTLSDLLNDFLVGFAVEGRLTTEEDIEDDTDAPDVALLRVASVNHLGSQVVGLTKNSVHRMRFVNTA